MNTFDSPLSVYCGKGRVTHLRFRSSVSQVSLHVGRALRSLGVSQPLSRQAQQSSMGADFASGLRFEEHDESIGLGELDQADPQHTDARRVVVYATYFHEQLEESIARTLGEMPSFEELNLEPEAEASVDEGGETWRLAS
jgi:hypothetical protein